MAEKVAAEYHDVTLGAVRDFGNETRDFELLFDPGKGMRFLPGQFISVVLPTGGKVLRRAYSIASPPQEKEHLLLIVKRVQGGLATGWFWGLKPGDRFRIHGPFGKFILPDPIDFALVFVATGTGIAPFRSMIHSLLRGGFTAKFSLLFGARYDTMTPPPAAGPRGILSSKGAASPPATGGGVIPYHGEWLDLARRHPHFTYLPTVSRPGPEWKGETGYVQAKVGKLLADPAATRVYICGLNEMIQPVQEVCLKAGLRKDQVSYEKYD